MSASARTVFPTPSYGNKFKGGVTMKRYKLFAYLTAAFLSGALVAGYLL
jgi:hypothetical protein